MPSFEELAAQKRKIEERKLALEKYRLGLVRIQSNINATIYRENSTWVTDYDIQCIKALEDQKKSKVAELKRDCQITPHRIPEQIKEYNHQISMISVQLDSMEQQGQQQQGCYDDLYDTAKKRATSLRLQEQSQDDHDRWDRLSCFSRGLRLPTIRAAHAVPWQPRARPAHCLASGLVP